MLKPKVGLLPLYIKLYDDFTPHYRPEIEAFHKLISNELTKIELDVVDVPICRIKSEFKAAVDTFINSGVDAIVTLHLAYSLSLESADILKECGLPIIILDTTPDYVYDGETDPSALSYNHGIHGVQDMCNLLRRNKCKYTVCAGHWEHSDVLNNVKKAATGIKLANTFKNSRAGIVGDVFDGMGDFQIDYDLLNINVIKYDGSAYDIGDDEIENEYQMDSSEYDLSDISKDVYIDTVKVELKIRKWIEENQLDSFTINFLSTSKDGALPYMPFCAASKAMRDGIGYAGEGDIMTSVLVGTLLKRFEYTSFTEMFCPDWKNNTIFLSHMGEQNLKCTDDMIGVKMYQKQFPYTTAGNPTALFGTFKKGDVLFICIAPQADNKFALIVAAGEMLGSPEINKHTSSVNGWFKPRMPIIGFLEKYSEYGGIHHAALVYDYDIDIIKQFADNMDFEYISI